MHFRLSFEENIRMGLQQTNIERKAELQVLESLKLITNADDLVDYGTVVRTDTFHPTYAASVSLERQFKSQLKDQSS